MPEPFYKSSRDTWYVELHGKQHSLGRHPKGAPKPKQDKKGRWKTPPEIRAAFHTLMVAPPEPPAPPVRSGSMKHGACRAVQRAMRWGEKKGHIDRSPVAHYENPRPGRRHVVIPPEE